MLISNKPEMIFQIFLNNGSDYIVNTNQNKQYCNDPSEPDLEGSYFVVGSADSRYGICQYPGEDDHRNTGSQWKNDG